jgi:hypothetical protein
MLCFQAHTFWINRLTATIRLQSHRHHQAARLIHHASRQVSIPSTFGILSPKRNDISSSFPSRGVTIPHRLIVRFQQTMAIAERIHGYRLYMLMPWSINEDVQLSLNCDIPLLRI